MTTEVLPLISATVTSVTPNQAERRNHRLHVGPPPHSLFLFMLAEGSIAVHQSHFKLTVGQLLLLDLVLGGKHLADLHKCFVLGFRDNEDGVEGHSQADRTEDQVAVRACRNLWWEVT